MQYFLAITLTVVRFASRRDISTIKLVRQLGKRSNFISMYHQSFSRELISYENVSAIKILLDSILFPGLDITMLSNRLAKRWFAISPRYTSYTSRFSKYAVE